MNNNTIYLKDIREIKECTSVDEVNSYLKNKSERWIILQIYIDSLLQTPNTLTGRASQELVKIYVLGKVSLV